MTLVVRQNVAGRPIGAPIALDRRRRRLSTIVARHADRARPFLVSRHRAGEALRPCDATVRLRADWARTLVGADDVVLITELPLGRSGGPGGGSNTGKQIGLAVAAIALAVAAPYAVPALAAAGLGAAAATVYGIATAGIIAGGQYLLNRAAAKTTQIKPTENAPLYGVSGGGNLPRPGDRIPRGYGDFWTQPDLSQPDYILYDGEDVVLHKRVTLGLGHYRVKSIEVGSGASTATLWTEDGGVHQPFVGAEVEIIEPGATSRLVPSTVLSSALVSSQELPRPGEFPDWAGPFPATPVGVETDTLQIDYSLPEGVTLQVQRPNGQTLTGAGTWTIQVQVAPCDADDEPTGPWVDLLSRGGQLYATRGFRLTQILGLPRGRYVVRARNAVPANPNQKNSVFWDGLRAHLHDTVVRPHVTEIALKVRSGKALGITAFAQVWVNAAAKLPVWTGAGYALQETRKAVWANLDIFRGVVNGVAYGAGLPDDQLDLGRHRFYADTLDEHDTFDGVIRGPVSVLEASATVLGAIRAEPARLGNAWSLTRDEPRAARKHHFTRRQIVRDTTASTFQVAAHDGRADVIVAYSADGDPRRRREVRKTFGSPSVTPRRYNLVGPSTYAHALQLATWIAASAYYRREGRRFVAEYEGRLVSRNDPALIDAWFHAEGTRAAGVVARDGAQILLDTEVTVEPGQTYASFRDRVNRLWGPVRVAAAPKPTTVVLNADDLAAVAAFTGVPFDDVFADDGAEPTSVRIGPLAELRDPYLIRSVEPQGRDRVAIEAVYDAPEVWDALGEALPPEPPVPGPGDDPAPAAPRVAWVSARPVQRTTALDMDWSVGPARGAAAIVVDLSYDAWATSERVSDGPATSGSYPLRHAEGQEVRVRARAIGAGGLAGPPAETSFDTFRPVISGDVADLIVELENLSAQLRHDLASINDLGAGLIGDHGALAGAGELIGDRGALAAAGDLIRGGPLRAAMQALNARIDDLASAAATEATHAFERRDRIKVALEGRVQDAFAAVEHETTARISAEEAAASERTALTVRLGAAEGAIVQEASTRATADTAEANARLTLTARVGAAEGAIVSEASTRATADTAEAAARQQLGVRVGAAEGAIVTEAATRASADAAEASARQALDSRLGTAEGALTTEASTRASADAAEATARQALATRVGQAEADLVTEASTRSTADAAEAVARQALDTRVGQAESAIVTEANTRATADQAEATARQALGTRLGQAEADLVTERQTRVDQNGARASEITALQTTVGGHTAQLTTLSQSVNGTSLRFGVAGTINNQTGGFVFQGVVRNDGSVSYGMAFDVQSFVITNGQTNKIPFGIVNDRVVIPDLLVTGSAQIASLVVDNIHIKGGAVTTSASVTTAQSADQGAFAITTRAGATVDLVGVFKGSQNTSQVGTVSLYRDGLSEANKIVTVSESFIQTSNGFYTLPTPIVAVDTPPPGNHVYYIKSFNGGGLILIGRENSK